MSFLSIAFLFALPLAAAPLLLHLFDRRRQVVIEWGAMQFLAEAASRRTKARKLKQWLLLLLRTAAVAALILALARPMLPGNWLHSDERAETILIIDNSMSMTRSTGDTSLLQQTVERAITEVQQLDPGDFVRVLLASPYPVWATTGSVRVDASSQKELVAELRQLRPTDGRSDLLSALFTAVQTELQPTQRERRIVLFSDGQRGDWSLDDHAGWKRFREVLLAGAVPTHLKFVEPEGSAEPQNNLAVTRIRSHRTVAGLNQPIRLAAHVQNHGQSAAPPIAAHWIIGQEEVHHSQVPVLGAGADHELVWQHSFSKPGVYRIACRIAADDQLAPDNQATVVIEVVEQSPVLVVEGAAELAEIQQDSFFLQAALGWIDGEPLDEKTVYVPTLIRPERLGQTDLKPYRAVVIPNLTGLDANTVEHLQRFVFDGGGLWIALGPRTDAEAFNQFLFADGNGLAPLAIEEITDETSTGGTDQNPAATTLDPFLKDHPATSELRNHEQLDLGEIAVVQRVRFAPPPESENASVLVSLSNGQPLAIEKYFGRGRVIVQGVPLRLQWSELVRSQAFVVMVQAWLDYLSQPRATRHNLQPGEPIAIQVADATASQATLRTPHGDEFELTADATGDELIFRSSRTVLPGDYWLDLGLTGNRIPFHVNRDVRESQLEPLLDADKKLLADVATLSNETRNAPLPDAMHSDPLWPLLLMILIGLIAAELLLSGLIARERFGAEPISETTEHWATEGLESRAAARTTAGVKAPEHPVTKAGVVVPRRGSEEVLTSGD